ncbi:beta-N-acetylglucosaminidase domain-containing protein [uncultured Bacteroides sp.]|jgi:hyaluronoglucosaminidase|uniref:beta-N-acetylglucosaminidase domain-containing protein n=1 Tax=uncultured Bacteroides sp. TaxID=162156 RepID=UPI0025E669D8|nr:beta-N-acetylglucosaminidase domain-containing protein [uncultured Bacteroides sp.]
MNYMKSMKSVNQIIQTNSMKKRWLGACLWCTVLMNPSVATAQHMAVQPVPQEVQMGGRTLSFPTALHLVGSDEANVHAVELLRSLLPDAVPCSSASAAGRQYRILIGEKNDKSVKKYRRQIPPHAEGYYLSVGKKEIVVAGYDERGTYYGVQTLRQLLSAALSESMSRSASSPKSASASSVSPASASASEVALSDSASLPEITVKDYPAVRYRGVVEGFYGTPWSHEARLRQLRFYGENKMNTYIYGPKNDPYHSCPGWRKPYPEKESAQIRELVKVAAENEVNFVWAIHPGQDIKWNDEDRRLLIAKLESMYNLGVRSFAVFFDDISGEGTDPHRQADLLNYIDRHFVKAKPDVTPLVMCPTEYNRSWSNPKGNYLTTLGEKLDPSIQIMWTGDKVVADIKEESMEWINARIRRPAYIWWNFPVSDYVRDHLLLGPVYGNDTHIASAMSGFVTNPMEHAEASKIAIYGVADYAWNPGQYDAQQAWEAAIREVLPGAAGELQFFAAHNSDLGINGHNYRREESVEVKPVADRFLKSYLTDGTWRTEDYQQLLSLTRRMQSASDILLVNTENRPLIEEITPWLLQFKLLGEIGEETLQLAQLIANGSVSESFLSSYRHIRALQQQLYLNDQRYNQNGYQPGMRPASLVIKPLIDQTFVAAVERYNRLTGSSLAATVEYSPHKLVSDVPQIQHLPLQARGKQVLVTPSNEVVRWGAGQKVEIELDKVYPLTGIIVNFFKNEPCPWGRFEISVDGKQWRTVEHVHQGVRQRVYFKNEPVRFVRFTNVSDEAHEVFFRQFVIMMK